MVRLKERLLHLLKDEEGQSTTEYILILAVVVMIAMKMRDKLAGDSGIISQGVDQLGGQIDGFFQ